MTEPIVRVEPARASVEPGGQVVVVVTVFNPGNRVEAYDLDIVSTAPMPWAMFAPETLSVYPQQEESAVLTFAPPSGPTAPGGSFAFGVRVQSQLDASLSSVAEGDLDIGSVAGLQATLTPVTSSGRWSGRHTVKVTNWGNAPARLRVSAQDPDQALGFLAAPEVLDVPLGGEAVSRLKVRTRHPVLRGTAQRLPFQVVLEPEVPETLGAPRSAMSTPDRPVVDGALNRKPILTRAVVALAGVVLLAGIGATAYALTRPGDGPAPDGPATLDQPTDVTARPLPGRVLITWAAAQGVDSYLLVQTKPERLDTEILPLVDPGDPGTFLVRLPVTTEEEYCYQLRANREDGAFSAMSEPEACVTTQLPAGETPSPSSAPTLETLPPAPGEETAGGGTGSSDSGGDGSPTESPTTGADGDPLPFISVLKFYNGAPGDPPPGAVTDQLALGGVGVGAKLLYTGDWTITPPVALDGWLLYVDATSPEDIATSCTDIGSSFPDLVVLGCAPPVRSVAGGATSLPSTTP